MSFAFWLWWKVVRDPTPDPYNPCKSGEVSCTLAVYSSPQTVKINYHLPALWTILTEWLQMGSGNRVKHSLDTHTNTHTCVCVYLESRKLNTRQGLYSGGTTLTPWEVNHKGLSRTPRGSAFGRWCRKELEVLDKGICTWITEPEPCRGCGWERFMRNQRERPVAWVRKVQGATCTQHL